MYLTTTHHYHDRPLKVWGDERPEPPLARFPNSAKDCFQQQVQGNKECIANSFLLFCTYKVQPCAFELHPMFGIVLRRAFAGPTQVADAPKEAGHWEMVVGTEYCDVDPKLNRLLVSTVAYFILFPDLSVYFILILILTLTLEIPYNHTARSKSNKFV